MEGMSSGRFASNWYRALFSNPLITWRPIHTHTFHVGSQVTIIPSHHAHGSKDGVVMQHTKKFVVIAVNWNKARILPKLLKAHSPNPTLPLQEHNGPTNPSPPPMPLLPHAPIDDDPTLDDKELEGSMYDKLDERCPSCGQLC